MIRVFIGYDQMESVAFHVLAQSIIRQSSEPVSITPIGNQVLPTDMWFRPRGEKDGTEFSNARWLVPMLCGYEGWAIFMDCDMLCQADIAELYDHRHGNQDKAVIVRDQVQEVTEGKKFLGIEQTRYDRKNWSSLMLFNCEHPRYQQSWVEYANTAPGLDLHQFAWCLDHEIGFFNGDWNHLLRPGAAPSLSPLPHFTLGGPWHGWTNYYEAYDWASELEGLLGHGNPCARVAVSLRDGHLHISGTYSALESDRRLEVYQEGEQQEEATEMGAGSQPLSSQRRH